MKYERCSRCREEVVWWAIFVNLFQTAFKGLLGLMTGSVALIADSLHSAADVVASTVTLISVKVSARKADEAYPFGYGSIQFISSSIVGLILIFGAIFLMYESIAKIAAGNITPPSALAILGACVSVVVNELMYRYQSCVGRENNSPAIIANAWDNRSDALSSAGVLVGIAFAVLGFPVADVIAALVVAVLVAKIGVELNIEAINGLMDSSVSMDVLKAVYRIAMDVKKVEEVEYLCGRNVGEEVHLDISLCVDGNLTVVESDHIAHEARQRIFSGIKHVKDVQVGVVPILEGAQIPAKA